MPKTTTVTIDDDLADALQAAGKDMGGIGWTRMIVVILTEWQKRKERSRNK